ncbi:MAG: hypothetical protein OEX19_15350, partial [Gammaproteobacteria bacterium]|nr:hypothetical protein [Gammaproteobacteria bacterium]
SGNLYLSGATDTFFPDNSEKTFYLIDAPLNKKNSYYGIAGSLSLPGIEFTTSYTTDLGFNYTKLETTINGEFISRLNTGLTLYFEDMPESLHDIAIDQEKQGEWRYHYKIRNGRLLANYKQGLYIFDLYVQYTKFEGTILAAYNATALADYWSSFLVNKGYLNINTGIESLTLGTGIGNVDNNNLKSNNIHKKNQWKWRLDTAFGELDLDFSGRNQVSKLPFGLFSTEEEKQRLHYLTLLLGISVGYQWKTINIYYQIKQITPVYKFNNPSNRTPLDDEFSGLNTPHIPQGNRQMLTISSHF